MDENVKANVINYLRRDCGSESIIVGEMENGKYILHIGDKSPPVPNHTLFLSEDALIGLTAVIMTYLKKCEIDFSEKVKEYFKDKPMKYIDACGRGYMKDEN